MAAIGKYTSPIGNVPIEKTIRSGDFVGTTRASDVGLLYTYQIGHDHFIHLNHEDMKQLLSHKKIVDELAAKLKT